MSNHGSGSLLRSDDEGPKIFIKERRKWRRRRILVLAARNTRWRKKSLGLLVVNFWGGSIVLHIAR